jgi:L-ascorbate metabolism protein UlaG (beta-lactamase superfamily)
MTTNTDPGTTRITWIGHGTVLVELDGVRLLTDPLVRSRLGHIVRVAGPHDANALRNVDAALVSHVHFDHFDMWSLRRLGRSVRVIVPVGAARMLRRRGFAAVTEVDVGDEVDVDGVTIRATPADHDGRRPPFLNKAPSLGYVIAGSARVYFAGDTDLFDGMSTLAPDLDVALLPVSGWGVRVPRGHLDPLRAAQALALLRPRMAIPIHWGTYRRIRLPRDPEVLRAPAESFARFAEELAPDVDVRLLPVGGSLAYAPADGGARTDGLARAGEPPVTSVSARPHHAAPASGEHSDE